MAGSKVKTSSFVVEADKPDKPQDKHEITDNDGGGSPSVGLAGPARSACRIEFSVLRSDTK